MSTPLIPQLQTIAVRLWHSSLLQTLLFPFAYVCQPVLQLLQHYFLEPFFKVFRALLPILAMFYVLALLLPTALNLIWFALVKSFINPSNYSSAAILQAASTKFLWMLTQLIVFFGTVLEESYVAITTQYSPLFAQYLTILLDHVYTLAFYLTIFLFDTTLPPFLRHVVCPYLQTTYLTFQPYFLFLLEYIHYLLLPCYDLFIQYFHPLFDILLQTTYTIYQTYLMIYIFICFSQFFMLYFSERDSFTLFLHFFLLQ